MKVLLGNSNAIEGYKDDPKDDEEEWKYRAVEGDQITEIQIPDGVKLAEAFQTVIKVTEHHFDNDPETEDILPPAWIGCESEGLRALLCEHFGVDADQPVPEQFGEHTIDAGTLDFERVADEAEDDAEPEPEAKGGGKSGGAVQGMLMMPLLTLSAMALLMRASPFLRTNVGADLQANVMGATSGTGLGTGALAPANYIGLTANATAASASDTTLTSEIGSGTLIRAQATFAHTTSATTYTLTKVFTSDQGVTIAKIGVFNASSSGVMMFESLLGSTAVLISGDQLSITETVTI